MKRALACVEADGREWTRHATRDLCSWGTCLHTVRFYQTPAGREVIKEWLRSFEKPDRAILGYDLKRVQLGFPIGLPLCRSLGGGLWEVRSSLAGNREARMIFFHDAEHQALVVVHGFIKKSQKTPKAEIDVAMRRLKERGLYEAANVRNEVPRSVGPLHAR